MFAPDSKRPSAPIAEHVMPGGVRIIVRDPTPPPSWMLEEPEPEPLPQPQPLPTVVIRPPAQPGRAKEAFYRELDRKYGPHIRKLLQARRDVLPESAKDLGQGALEILFNEVEANGLPPHVERYLGGVLRNLVLQRRDKWSPDIDRGATGDDVPWSAPGPASEADQAQQWSRLFRHLATLSEDSIEEAEAVQCIDILGMSLEEAARELGRPVSTVQRQAKRGIARLRQLVQESDRATALGLRRR